MTEIKVRPNELDQNADTIRNHAAAIQSAIDQVDAELQRMNASVFAGQRADELRNRYQQMRETLMSFSPMLKQFSKLLNDSASVFRAADTANQ